MLVIEDNFNVKLNNTYIALGSFDGLHMGHLKLINKTMELANKSNGKSMVFNFKNHPLSIINKDLKPKLLMNNETKIHILEELKLDIVNFAIFDKDFMKLSPEEFIKNLVNYYDAKAIIVGFNHRFGYKNLGDVELLKKLSHDLNFELHVVNPVLYNGEIISSSKIRNLISEDGNVEKARVLLTRPYELEGIVGYGKQLGRTIGFPTLNIKYNEEFVLPRGGVYFTLVEIHNKTYRGITNIGYNPTVDDEKFIKVETHVLDFSKNVYNDKVRLKFISRIRDEKKFNSLKELKQQLEYDKTFAQSQSLF